MREDKKVADIQRPSSRIIHSMFHPSRVSHNSGMKGTSTAKCNQSINKNKKTCSHTKIMKYVKEKSKKVCLEWDIGLSAESNLKTQYSLVPRFSLTDVLSLPKLMVANGRMLPNLPRLLSVLLVSVLSQNRGTTHMMVRAFTNHDYHPSCQCLWQGRKYEHGQVLLRLVGLF